MLKNIPHDSKQVMTDSGPSTSGTSDNAVNGVVSCAVMFYTSTVNSI